jgi:hypothetical protein
VVGGLAEVPAVDNGSVPGAALVGLFVDYDASAGRHRGTFAVLEGAVLSLFLAS